MKASLIMCMEDLVLARSGRAAWETILTASGLPTTSIFLAVGDVDDEIVGKILGNTATVLGLTVGEVFDAFANQWVNVYGPRVYKPYYQGARSAREFFLRLDDMHARINKSIPNARTPRFTTAWKSKRTLVMVYQSDRGMIDLVVCMAKAIGGYFGEEIQVSKVSPTNIEIIFPS